LHCHAVHRLDRLTSGLCILAKDAPSARMISQQIRERSVEKYYLARVFGRFPDGDSMSNELQNCLQSNVLEGYLDDQGKESLEIIVEAPIYCVSQRLSKHAVPKSDDEEAIKKAKECRSVFRRLSYNGSTSLVLCRPFTGRTHQLRVHLQWLGFSIANDPNYGGKLCFGNSRAPSELGGLEFLKSRDKMIEDPLCWDCDAEKSMKVALSKPNIVYCTEIWLFALRYSSADWVYEVPPPDWANSNFNCVEYLKTPADAEFEQAIEEEEEEKDAE
jgi:23S rRNA-/tRNA-specific pseudouridylate synthase